MTAVSILPLIRNRADSQTYWFQLCEANLTCSRLSSSLLLHPLIILLKLAVVCLDKRRLHALMLSFMLLARGVMCSPLFLSAKFCEKATVTVSD